MKHYDATTYGAEVADSYDSWSRAFSDTEDTANFLAELAAESGKALELGVGTGRVALALARKGIPMWGIDISEDMLTQLREQPDGHLVQTSLGDMADVDVDERFQLVFAVYNTFFAVLTQDDQVRCFENVAAHLEDGGCFVVEAYVPDLSRYDRDGGRAALGYLTGKEIGLETSRVDPVRQRVDSQVASISHEGIRLYPAELRYAWPSEMDLMARVAGLRLVQRWGDWCRRPFTEHTERHVSVYRKPSL